MRKGSDYIDPFNAPELYIDGVAYREMVGSDIVRTAFYAKEQGEHVIRVKMLFPVELCLRGVLDLNAWLKMQRKIQVAS